MPDTPLMRPKDVSPESPFYLRGSTRYVVGYTDGAGKVVIRSQHTGIAPAERMKRRMIYGGSGESLSIFQVTR